MFAFFFGGFYEEEICDGKTKFETKKEGGNFSQIVRLQKVFVLNSEDF